MAEPLPPPGYADIARRMAGTPARDDERERAEVLIPVIALNLERVAQAWVVPRHDAERQVIRLHRATMRRRLAAVSEAARLLARELADPMLRVYLDKARDRPMAPAPRRLPPIFAELADRAASAGTAIRPRTNPSQAAVPASLDKAGPDRLRARQVAALAILAGWELLRRAPADEDSRDAQGVAELFWLAATGGNDGGGWRHHLIEAKALQKLIVPDDLFGTRSADPRAAAVADVLATMRGSAVPAAANRNDETPAEAKSL